MIVTVTLNPALHVRYQVRRLAGHGDHEVSRVSYRAGGQGLAVARVLHAFGHDVLAAGLAGGATGELIRTGLARAGVPTRFTAIGRESRRVIEVTAEAGGPAGDRSGGAARPAGWPGSGADGPGGGADGLGGGPDGLGGGVLRFREPPPFITTEELGRLAGDYRALLADATAVVLSGGLPAGLPPDIYATLTTYAVEAGVPAVIDAGGMPLRHALPRKPALVVLDRAETAPAAGPDHSGPGLDPAALVAGGVGGVVLAGGGEVRAVIAGRRWRAFLPGGQPPQDGPPAGPAPQATEATGRPAEAAPPFAAAPPVTTRAGQTVQGALPAFTDRPASREALVAGLLPGLVLGWSWPDRLRHAVALAAAATATGDVDLDAYERLLPAVTVRH